MKKVLALVLALTMVLGFAATASAYWTNVEYNLFKDGQEPVYTIDGIEDTTEADVDGNKEYTIKAKFDSDDLNNFLGNNDSTYDMLYQEYQVLKAIDSFTGYVSENWWAGIVTDMDENNIRCSINDLYRAVKSIVNDPLTDSQIYAALISAVGSTPGSFEKGYESTSFRNARRNLEAEWDRYYGNSYYGYEDGIAVYASSDDSTYATVTSQPTIKVTRDVDNAITNYEVSFKVRFTNTTFRTADVDIDVTYRAGGSVQEAFYSHEDTLSFTVFQAQAGCPRWQFAHGDR